MIRSKPMEKPQAGTFWPQKRPTISSYRPPPATEEPNSGSSTSKMVPV